MAVLLYNLALSEKHQKVGYNDADAPLLSILSKLNSTVEVTDDDMEKLLYASNLLNEEKDWKHPLGLNFESWVKEILGKDKFDKIYNTIERV